MSFRFDPVCSDGSVGDVEIGPNFGESSELGLTMAITRCNIQMQVTDLSASKDSWTDNLAICGGDANHDGTPLEVEGLTAAAKRAYGGWDVSTYPTGMTVTSLAVKLVLDTAPAVTNQTIDVHLIAGADEGWTESNIRCSNDPVPDGAAVASFTVATSDSVGTVYDVTLNSTARTRLAARMGVGTFSLLLNNASAIGTNLKFEDKDSGGASGPRLTFTANKNLSV